MSPILCSGDVGECLARHLPSGLSTRITRNPVVRGIRVLATKGFEGEEINKENKPRLLENSGGKRSIDSFEN